MGKLNIQLTGWEANHLFKKHIRENIVLSKMLFVGVLNVRVIFFLFFFLLGWGGRQFLFLLITFISLKILSFINI